MKTPENLLYYGDHLDVLRRNVDDESVDLITPAMAAGVTDHAWKPHEVVRLLEAREAQGAM